MTRHLMLAGAAAAALTLSACNKPQDAAPPASEQTATPDANPAATVPTPANEAAAPDFVMKAGIGDIYEIAAAKLAAEKAQDPKVKAFAKEMTTAHTKSSADLKTAIAASGQTALQLPTALPADMQSRLDDLGGKSPADFDKAYLDDQIDAHQNALNLLQRYAEDGDVEAIKTFATTTAPVVQQHLDNAKALRDAMK
jgi:putative membrane protein